MLSAPNKRFWNVLVSKDGDRLAGKISREDDQTKVTHTLFYKLVQKNVDSIFREAAKKSFFLLARLLRERERERGGGGEDQAY